MSVIQLWAKRCKRTPVLARGDDPPEPPAHGGASRPPVPPWGLACRTMNQRVLVASNRGPVSYQFGADGSLTGSRGGGGMIAGVTDGLAARRRPAERGTHRGADARHRAGRLRPRLQPGGQLDPVVPAAPALRHPEPAEVRPRVPPRLGGLPGLQ